MMKNENDYCPDNSELCFLLISFFIVFLGFISTFYKFTLLFKGIADKSDKANLAANIICLGFIFSYYYLLLKQKKPYRLLISIPYTVYVFFIFLISSYYYVIPFMGMILAIILLAMSRIRRNGIILSSCLVVFLYTLLMILQETKILPIFPGNIDSLKKIKFASLICLEAILVCISFGIYNLACRRNVVFEMIKKRKEEKRVRD